jgi:hypothetical protein
MINRLKKNIVLFADNLVQTTDVLNERGDKINMMVRKADNLRTESKMFYKNVKAINSVQASQARG